MSDRKLRYDDYVMGKIRPVEAAGFEPMEIHAPLFEWQKMVVRWALKQGRAALFEDCGLGKTLQQMEWARQVATHVQMPVLILCPLAVAEQTVAEGQKFGITITHVREPEDVRGAGIYITNYERLEKFDEVVFGGVGNLWGTLVGAFTLGIANKFLEPFAGAVLGKIALLVFIILFIQKRPRGLFALKGRAVEA